MLYKYKLSDLKVGEYGTVLSIDTDEKIKRRLLDIGLVPGTKVECLLKSPLGEPKAYNIRGCIFALRNEDTKKIIITL